LPEIEKDNPQIPQAENWQSKRVNLKNQNSYGFAQKKRIQQQHTSLLS
jgi:hypothetical protein